MAQGGSLRTKWPESPRVVCASEPGAVLYSDQGGFGGGEWTTHSPCSRHGLASSRMALITSGCGVMWCAGGHRRGDLLQHRQLETGSSGARPAVAEAVPVPEEGQELMVNGRCWRLVLVS